MGISVEGWEDEEVSCIELGCLADEEGRVMAGAGSMESYGLREVEGAADDVEDEEEV